MISNTPLYALLLQPPPGDLTGPYPALCYLKSYAEWKGFKVTVRDLGIEALLYLAQADRVAALMDRATALRKDLDARKFQDELAHHRYHLLQGTATLPQNPDAVSEGLQVFRDPARFFDYGRYLRACRQLDAFYQLLSAVHFPTVLTAAEYPTATMLRTLDGILEHRNARVNPFIGYYEEVLFPLLAANPPAVVGISMVFANQAVNALVLGHLIKERFPGIYVVMGGAFLSQWAMVAGDAQLAQLFIGTDAIICGEGEQPFTDLLSRILQKQPADGIPNLIHIDPHFKKIVRFKEMNYTNISEQPPPDFSDLDMGRYLSPQAIIPYSISRGCYWGKCAFCQNRYGDYHVRRYQTVPVEKALSEMKHLSETYRTRHFNFSNDVIDPTYLKRFSRAVLAEGTPYVWNTDLRAEKAFDAETCRLMARAGLNSAAIGFESASQKVLDAMDKGNRVERTRRVMQHLYQAGVATQAMGIFGFPGETEADGLQTVQFLEENMDVISYYVIGLLMVMPGSKLYKHPKAHGVAQLRFAAPALMTPEPVWTSPARMSIDSVNRLYERLNRLESFYALDEYPYLGALSTNHSFLYFTLGPDILKRLRRENP
jgi:anaerobic magnesium-protoporphyrin IX monomethyl ester cyclase